MTPPPEKFRIEDESTMLPHCPSTPHSSPKLPLDHFTDLLPCKVDRSNFEEHSPEELVDKALKTLQDAGVQLIEWLSLLHRRMGVPVIVKDFHYLVPDEQLDSAVKLLVEQEQLPQSRPPPILIRTGGDFYTKALMFRVTRYTSLAMAQHLVLYPASLASYSPSDLSPVPRLTSLCNPLCHTVLVPSPPAVYASILRSMKSYPRFDPARITLQSDLSQLVDYNLYGLDCGYVDVDDEELCQELEVDRRVEDAVCTVEGWRRDDSLHDPEGWVGDALANVVSGRWTVEDVPWTARPCLAVKSATLPSGQCGA